MSAYTGKDLARAFRGVRGHTIQIANEIPEDKYGATGAPGTKTVAQLLTHIAFGARFQRLIHGNGDNGFAGLDFQSFMREQAELEGKTCTKAEIVALLQKEGDDFAGWLDSLSDEFLAQHVQMFQGPPASKSRLEMLLSPKEHEMHHRAQLMLIQRQLGITPHLTRARQEAMAAQAAGKSS
jgi:uncharacterized damage-inducible protein DinB